LLGANIGTTSTAWLVSLKLTGIGPFFIVLGTVLSAMPTRFKVIGKAAFYFGFIFFSLDLVSFTLKPLAQSPLFAEVLSRSSTPMMGVLAGAVVTAIVQSRVSRPDFASFSCSSQFCRQRRRFPSSSVRTS